MAITDGWLIIGSSDDWADYMGSDPIDLEDMGNYINDDIFYRFAVAGIRPIKEPGETRKKIGNNIRASRMRTQKFHITFQPFYVLDRTGENTFKNYLYLTNTISIRDYIWLEVCNLTRLGTTIPSDPPEAGETNYWGYGTFQRHREMVELVEESVTSNFEKGLEEVTWTVQMITPQELA